MYSGFKIDKIKIDLKLESHTQLRLNVLYLYKCLTL